MVNLIEIPSHIVRVSNCLKICLLGRIIIAMRTFERMRRSAVQTGLSTGTSTKTEANLVERAKRLGIGI